jgi:hypothetical protein
MSECCPPDYSSVFSTRQAARDAKRYRRRGLRWGPRRTVELYRDGVIAGASLLEVGGGIGDLQVELLRAGVEHATSVELTPSYEETAGRLLADAGLATRVRRTVADFAVSGDEVPDADIVVAHSVVCCYPDGEALTAAMARRARRYLVLTYPRDVWWMHVNEWATALYARVRRSDWRFVVHPPAALLAAAAAEGLEVAHEERNLVDHLTVLGR